MTYGVYTEDLKAYSLTEVSLETARRYLYKGHVVCSEKRVKCGFEIKIYFHKYFLFQLPCRWRDYIELGFVQIMWRIHTYSTADKIIEKWNGGDNK